MSYFTRGFRVALVFSFILLIGSLLFWANTVVTTPAQVSQEQQQIQSERQNATAISIFLNNFMVSIPMVIPVVGVLFFYLVIWHNTATAIGLLAVASNTSATSYALADVTLAFPEVLAYIILFAEMLYVTFLAIYYWQDWTELKDRVREESWKTFLFYVLLLFVSAIIEVIIIESTQH